MKKLGSGCLGALVLFIGAGFLVNGCVNKIDRAVQAPIEKEQQRVASLTPEQQGKEEKAKADAKAASEKSADVDRMAINAQVQAEKVVKQFLKYPNDAKFGWFSDCQHDEEGTKFLVTNTVDAKNGFGGVHTKSWRVSFVNDGGSLKVRGVMIDGEIVYAGDTSKEVKTEEASPGDKEAFRDARIAANEARKEQAKAKHPETAAAMLKSANQFKAGGDNEAAARWFKRVIEQYAETASANEARVALGVEPEQREWTDSTGKRKIRAAYLAFADGKAKLRKEDGKEIPMPLEKLSAEDQDYLRAVSAKK